MTDIEQQHRELLDRQAIVDTAIRYTWALDQKRWDDLDDVFTADAQTYLMRTVPENGIDEIKERIRSSLAPLDDSQHIVSNHQVVLNGDTATHRCYLHAQHIYNDVEGSPLFVVAGRYEDEMMSTDDGWRITRRDLIAMWTDGNPSVLRASRS